MSQLLELGSRVIQSVIGNCFVHSGKKNNNMKKKITQSLPCGASPVEERCLLGGDIFSKAAVTSILWYDGVC